MLVLAWSGDLFVLAITPSAVLTNNPRTGTLTARDPTSGSVLWSTYQSDASAAATDQLAYSGGGNIRRLSDGALVGTVQGPGGDSLVRTTPANGRIFGVSTTNLYAFSPTAG